MSHKFHHELIARGNALLHKLASTPIAICGAGALGSNLAMNLARMGASQLTIIDRDRVEESNMSTQVYSLDDVGGQKAELLRNQIFRQIGIEAQAHPQELRQRNAKKLLSGNSLIVDAFDNAESRAILHDFSKVNHIDCLHVGVNDLYGEIRWNETYIVPSCRGEDVCDYPLARNLVLLVTAIASEAVIRYLKSAEKRDYAITLSDLVISASP